MLRKDKQHTKQYKQRTLTYFVTGQIQTIQRGGQPYIDTSPYEVSECSLVSVSDQR